MRFIIVLIFISMLSFVTTMFFNSVGEVVLGLVLSSIMFVWPIGFWALSKTTEGWGVKKAEEKTEDVKEKVKEVKEEEIEPVKENTIKLKEDLERLKKVSETLDEEKRQGMLSEDAYNELKKQNEEAIKKMERMKAKASGDFGEKKVYCKKGDHYIDVRDCIESKVPGYIICQEHNEEIRVE